MTKEVPYISKPALEREAYALLSEFSRTRGVALEASIPIEDIVEKHLKLRLEFDDLHAIAGIPRIRRNGAPDILGAIFLGEKRVVIDESLDPEVNPEREARYRFTLAHEIAHWCLHRYLFAETGNWQEVGMRPPVVCRVSQAKMRIEWQADYFASCLLMPRRLLANAWKQSYPDGLPRALAPCPDDGRTAIEFRRIECRIGMFDCSEGDDEALERIAAPFAERFQASPVAMRIRLENMGLLLRPKLAFQRRLDFA